MLFERVFIPFTFSSRFSLLSDSSSLPLRLLLLSDYTDALLACSCLLGAYIIHFRFASFPSISPAFPNVWSHTIDDHSFTLCFPSSRVCQSAVRSSMSRSRAFYLVTYGYPLFYPPLYCHHRAVVRRQWLSSMYILSLIFPFLLFSYPNTPRRHRSRAR